MKPPAWGHPVRGNDWAALAGQVASPLPAVSVIVLHYEQPAQLARTLLALRRQTYAAHLELIVVDDGSSEPPDVPADVRLIRQDHQGARRGAARNRGAQVSRGEVLCFLDADTVPEPDYIAALTRLPGVAPEAVTVGRRRHAQLDGLDPGADIAVVGPAHELRSPHWLADGYLRTHDLREAGPRDFRFMISAVLSCTTWFFNEVGGFDESFGAYGGEDWEWAHRAWLRGAVFAHARGAVAWHDGPGWRSRHAGVGSLAAMRAEKNAEAMRLARLITVAGHRSRGLLGHRAETLVELDAELQPGAAFICADSLLSALPASAVIVPEELVHRYRDDPRLLAETQRGSDRAAWPALFLTVHAALSTEGPDLGDLCAGILERDEGVWRLCDASGELMTIESSRHRARVGRWGPSAGLSEHVSHPSWLRRLGDPADVEAYLGGWAR